MTAIVIPVKPLESAKQRLSGVLTPVQRAELVLAMLHDILTVATAFREHRVWVVTRDKAVDDLARQHGAGVIPEVEVRGYNAAVDAGLQYLQTTHPEGTNVAVVPADVPMVTSEDLGRLTAACDTACSKVRLAPARDAEGTNGLFLSRTDLLQPVFGQNSYSRYRSQCRLAGLTPELLTDSSLGVDVDIDTDLQFLRARHACGNTGAYLSHLHSIGCTNAGLSLRKNTSNTLAADSWC